MVKRSHSQEFEKFGSLDLWRIGGMGSPLGGGVISARGGGNKEVVEGGGSRWSRRWRGFDLKEPLGTLPRSLQSFIFKGCHLPPKHFFFFNIIV